MGDAEVCRHSLQRKPITRRCNLVNMITRSENNILQERPYPDAPALPTAAWHGQVAKVKKLIKEGADVNQRGSGEDKVIPQAPLSLAIEKASTVLGACEAHFLLMLPCHHPRSLTRKPE